MRAACDNMVNTMRSMKILLAVAVVVAGLIIGAIYASTLIENAKHRGSSITCHVVRTETTDC